MLPQPHVAGVVLAGGQSRRMGVDKADLILAGDTLLTWVVTALATVCSELVIVGPARITVKSSDSTRWVTEELPGRGPFGALVAGLEVISCEYAIVTGCDTPLLHPQLLVNLAAASMDGRYDAVVPEIFGQPQPLHALYRREAAHKLRQPAPSAHSPSLQAALSVLTGRLLLESTVREWDPELVSFEQVNTPEEWARVQSIVEERCLRPQQRPAWPSSVCAGL